MQLAIFKKGEDTPVAQGDGSATLTGLAPETDVAAGDYQAALFDGTNYGNKVDVPAFKTLPDYAANGKAAGATDGAAGKPAADNSKQPQPYQDAYTAAYTPAKAKYDSDKAAADAKAAADKVAKDKADGTTAGKADGDAGKNAADNSGKSKDYSDAYTAAYTPAKSAWDAKQPKPATGIKLSQATASMKVGDTKQVTAAADPTTASDADAVAKATKYASSDDTIATVAADGTITAVKEGSATITATSGSFTATVKVTVTAAA